MIGLLRAEGLRLRKRRDIWLVALALVALSIVAYASGLSSAEANFGSPPGEQIPPEILERIRQQRLEYAFPLSVGSVVQNGQILILALVAYVAAAVSGAEYAYGTIRTSLVAHADRRGFMIVRLAGLTVVSVVLIGLLVVVGAILPVIATLLGTRFPGVVDPEIASLSGVVAVTLLTACFVIGLTSLWVVLVRNAAIALVLTIAYVLSEGAIVGLIVRAVGEESPVRWVLPVADLQLLFGRVHDSSMGAAMPTPLAISLGIAWVLATWAAAVGVLARSDIRE
jgi:ABC-type transport system involved in multi-copper enzyme maturation permease subunit